MVRSMSRKGDCWDSAVAERFFASVEHEYRGRHTFATPAQARLRMATEADQKAHQSGSPPSPTRCQPRRRSTASRRTPTTSSSRASRTANASSRSCRRGLPLDRRRGLQHTEHVTRGALRGGNASGKHGSIPFENPQLAFSTSVGSTAPETSDIPVVET